MKKRRNFLLVVLTLLIACIVCYIAATMLSDNKHEHEHTYSEEWLFDDNYHWKAANCEHSDLISEKGEHQYDENYRCICGKSFDIESKKIQIMGVIRYSLYVSNISIKQNDQTVELILSNDAVYHKQNDVESYFAFGEGFYEKYYMNNSDWVKETISDDIDMLDNNQFLEYYYPMVYHLEESCREIDFTYDVNNNTVSYVTDSVNGYKDLKATLQLEGDALKKVTASFCYGEDEHLYEVAIDWDEKAVVIPDEAKISKNIDFAPTEYGTYKITGLGDCTDKNLVIPSHYNGIEITEIADGAFFDANIHTVQIPGTIKRIGVAAFENCTELQSIIIGDGTEEICERAFALANPHAYLEFTDSVKTIGENAFYCDKGYAVRTQWNFVGDINKYVQIDFQGEDSTPNAAREMYLNGNPLVDVVVDTAPTISQYAFSGLNSPKNYYIGKQVTSIGNNALCGFASEPDPIQGVALIPYNVYFEGTIQEFLNVEIDRIWASGSGWLLYCNQELVETVVIEDMDTVRDSQFNYCVSLRNLIIKDGVKSIGAFAFCGCPLETVEIAESVVDFGYGAFEYMTWYSNGSSAYNHIELSDHNWITYLKNVDNDYYLMVSKSENAEIHPDCKRIQNQDNPYHQDT